MKITLLYTGSTGFPLGDAYTNRILSLAKGFISIDCHTNILIIYPGRKSGVYNKKGIYDSVPYEYLTPKETSKYFLLKKLYGFLGIIRAVNKLFFHKKNIDAIISFTESSLQNIPIGLIAKVKGILFIREVNEYPKAVLRKGVNGLSPLGNCRIKKSLIPFNGLLCISSALFNYFKTRHAFNKPSLVVPIVVDKLRFQIIPDIPPEKYITYCGNLFGDKDGVEILIKAFSKIFHRFRDYKLLLIGDISESVKYNKLLKLIQESGLSRHVEFTGYKNRDEVPALLCKSAVLALARPDNIQAQAGFPTKLGEYLATSRPVITTAVGDIPDYITDGVNGFLAEPGNINNLAEKISFVLENYVSAIKIGKKGRELTDSIFNPSFQAKRIQEFIMDLQSNR